MIGYFIKPPYRGDLARCTVIFPAFAGLCLLVPLAFYGLWSQLLLPPTAPGWLQGLPFWLWMAWMVGEWLQLVRLVRAQPVRSNSPSVFYLVSIVCLVGFPVDMWARTRAVNVSFLNVWLVVVEVAMLVFFLGYFLLALCSWTRVSWQAPVGFLLVTACLALEVYSANHPAR